MRDTVAFKQQLLHQLKLEPRGQGQTQHTFTRAINGHSVNYTASQSEALTRPGRSQE